MTPSLPDDVDLLALFGAEPLAESVPEDGYRVWRSAPRPDGWWVSVVLDTAAPWLGVEVGSAERVVAAWRHEGEFEAVVRQRTDGGTGLLLSGDSPDPWSAWLQFEPWPSLVIPSPSREGGSPRRAAPGAEDGTSP